MYSGAKNFLLGSDEKNLHQKDLNPILQSLGIQLRDCAADVMVTWLQSTIQQEDMNAPWRLGYDTKQIRMTGSHENLVIARTETGTS